MSQAFIREIQFYTQMVNKEEMSWFHCGKCGALFMAQMGELPDRRCTECGAAPSVGIIVEEKKAVAETVAVPVSSTGKRVVRKGRKPLIVKLLLAWVLFMAAIVAVGIYHTPKEVKKNSAQKMQNDQQEKDEHILNQAIPTMSRSIDGFLTAVTPEEANQFVYDPTGVAGKVQRFYQSNARIPMDAKSMRVFARGLVHTPSGDIVEMRWRMGNRIYQTFFIKNNQGDWLMDWQDFERYSDYPWSVFLHEGGEAEGEFRLFARERLAEEKKSTPQISLVLYAPKSGHPEALGAVSPEILVDRSSHSGRMLAKAFELEKKGIQIFQSSLLRMDPEGLIRVRLKIRRTGEGDARSFTVEDVMACHWLSIPDPGVTVEDAPPAR